MRSSVSREPTRRELMRGGLLLGAAGSVVAAGAVPGRARAAVPTDAEQLVPLIGSELLVAFGYQQIMNAQLLSPRGNRLAERVLDQEQQHITALSKELVHRGGTPPAPISSVGEADKVLSARQIPGSLADLHNEHDAIILLARFEWLLEGAYLLTITSLRDPHLMRLSAQIMANEAQHGTMLSELLHPGDVNKAVPSSYVVGTH